MGEVSHLPEHRTCSAIPLLGELNGSCHRVWLEVVPSDDVLDGNLDKHHRVLFGAHTPDIHFVAGHLLALLAQNRDDIHPGTACQAD